MSTPGRTPFIYDIIARGGTAARYRESARFVSNMDTRGVFSDIEVVVRWGGHEGRARIHSSYTSEALTQLCSARVGFIELRTALFFADHAALTSLVREANDANDTRAGVYYAVEAALGKPPHRRVPIRADEVGEWLSFCAPETSFDLGDA